MKVKSSKNQFEMQDPTKQYPPPKFPKQSQPVPGLARQMDPKPDHGEESYKGLGRLVGRKALITGADSGIGRAAAIAFAREGADIALNFLPSEGPDAMEVVTLIEKAGRKAVPLPGDIQDEEFCRELVENARSALKGLDILVNGRAPAGTSKHRGNNNQAIRRNIQDERLRHVLAVQGRAAAHAAGCGHHQHGLDRGLFAIGAAPRLFLDEGRHRRVYEGPRQAGRSSGHSGKCRRSRPNLDATTNQRRTTTG